MNCKQVEGLMPLYTGLDLEDESTGLIAAHLQNCTECAASALEYDRANQLLRQFEPPRVSDAAYAAVRHRVWREIETGSGALTLRQLLLRPFQPRAMWAVTTAVLLVVCAFAYHFIADRSNISPDQPATATAIINRVGTSGGATGLATSSARVGLNQDTPNVIAGGPPASPGSPNQPRLSLKTQTAWHSTKAGESSTPDGLAVRGSRTPAVPINTVQYSPEESSIKPLNTSVTSGKTLRLELQTKDPNIRIIWFSQPSTNEGSPNESSKGI